MLLLVSLIGLSLVYLLGAAWFGRREGKADAALFNGDPRNRFRRVFHRQRAWWRFVALFAGAIVAVLPLALTHQQHWFAGIGACLAMTGFGVWNLAFTPTLNLDRRPAKPAFYVSISDTAPRFDQHIVALATYFIVPVEELARLALLLYVVVPASWLLLLIGLFGVRLLGLPI